MIDELMIFFLLVPFGQFSFFVIFVPCLPRSETPLESVEVTWAVQCDRSDGQNAAHTPAAQSADWGEGGSSRVLRYSTEQCRTDGVLV